MGFLCAWGALSVKKQRAVFCQLSRTRASLFCSYPFFVLWGRVREAVTQTIHYSLFTKLHFAPWEHNTDLIANDSGVVRSCWVPAKAGRRGQTEVIVYRNSGAAPPGGSTLYPLRKMLCGISRDGVSPSPLLKTENRKLKTLYP